jgi:hypothetical protein
VDCRRHGTTRVVLCAPAAGIEAGGSHLQRVPGSDLGSPPLRGEIFCLSGPRLARLRPLGFEHVEPGAIDRFERQQRLKPGL